MNISERSDNNMNNMKLNEERATIVIVDDKEDNLEMLTHMLSDRGYIVKAVDNGQDAVDMIRHTPPDIILLDIMMPDMDGYDVCRILKADENTQNIPIIFITALNAANDKIAALTVGGADYITKPFHFEEVLVRVNTHLALNRTNKRLQEQVAELDAFTHTVAHNLKNPLNTVTNALDAICTKNGKLTSIQKQDLLGLAQRSTQEINNIIDELLLLANVQKNEITLTPINMKAIISHVLQRIFYTVIMADCARVRPLDCRGVG